jgi:hypothetical protein
MLARLTSILFLCLGIGLMGALSACIPHHPPHTPQPLEDRHFYQE